MATSIQLCTVASHGVNSANEKLVDGDNPPSTKKSLSTHIVITITVTIYFINPSRKLKLSFDRTTKNIIILNHEPPAHTHS